MKMILNKTIRNNSFFSYNLFLIHIVLMKVGILWKKKILLKVLVVELMVIYI